MKNGRCWSLIIILSFGFATVSCFSSITTSSRLHISQEQSSHSVALPADKATRKLVDLFAQRGCQLIDRRQLGPAEVLLKFKGARTAVTTVLGNQNGTYGQTSNIGSVYFVNLKQVSPEQTWLYIFGKPTMDGQEVCTDQPSVPDPGQAQCSDVSTGVAWTGREQMTGREEAETIRSIWLGFDIQ